MSLPWTKHWAPGDDGTTLKAADLRNIQDDIDSYITVNPTSGVAILSGNQTFSGNNTFSNAPIVPNSFFAPVLPIGSIYMNKTNSANPSTYLGYGTWVAVEGLVVAGHKAGDANFGTAGATVGAATVDASHAHTVPNTGWGKGSGSTNGTVATGANEGNDFSALDTANGVNSGTGGSTTLSVIQPTLVAYVWERTA